MADDLLGDIIGGIAEGVTELVVGSIAFGPSTPSIATSSPYAVDNYSRIKQEYVNILMERADLSPRQASNAFEVMFNEGWIKL